MVSALAEILLSPLSLRLVKTLSGRIIPLLLCIAVGTVVSWVSIYAFWFAVWTFHSIAAARAADAIGTFILYPARWVFELIGGDQSTIFYDPISFSGTNGLIVGILLYSAFRATVNRHANGKTAARPPQEPRRVEAKVRG
jgi:hypothetical protein